MQTEQHWSISSNAIYSRGQWHSHRIGQIKGEVEVNVYMQEMPKENNQTDIEAGL